jgi:hypothetical protein
MNDHHIVPENLKNDPVVRLGRQGGFKYDGKENKIPLEQFNKATGEGRHSKHPNYTSEVQQRLNKFQEENPNATPQQAAEFLRNLVKDLQQTINNNPGTKVNDLFSTPPSSVSPTDNTGTKPIVDPKTPAPPKPKPQNDPCNGNPDCI